MKQYEFTSEELEAMKQVSKAQMFDDKLPTTGKEARRARRKAQRKNLKTQGKR